LLRIRIKHSFGRIFFFLTINFPACLAHTLAAELVWQDGFTYVALHGWSNRTCLSLPRPRVGIGLGYLLIN
jgi:hypothetical protein